MNSHQDKYVRKLTTPATTVLYTGPA